MSDMDQSELDRVREAWRNASNADVVLGLSNPEDYSPQVFAIVREEAGRRGLAADSVEVFGPRDYEPARRGVALGIRVWRVALPGAREHPFIGGLVLGVGVVLLGMMLKPWLTGSVTALAWAATDLALMFYVSGPVVICWPLLRYRGALVTPLGQWLSAMVIKNVWWLLLARTFTRPASYWLIGTLVSFAMYCGGLTVLLVGAVYVRRRYWPVYEPGRCRGCGYDLRGLPELRCPECGRPFSDAEADLAITS